MSVREQIPMKPAALPLQQALTPTPLATLQRKCACGSSAGAGDGCEECKKKAQIQRRRASHGEEPGTVPPIVKEVLNSPGQPLDAETRALFEPSFSYDFGKVRVHTDSRAAESARAVQAHAYTVGRHVVFGTAQYAPRTALGKSLMAHELTHVVQQSQNAQGADTAWRISSPTDAAEREAESIGRASLNGQVTPPQATSSGTLLRLGANAGCSTEQANSIHQGIYDSRGWLKKAIPQMDQSPLSAKVLGSLKSNFGATYGVATNAPAIKAKLSTALGALGTNPFSCATDATDTLCKDHCGDSAPGSNASTICSNITLKPSGDTVFRAGCVLHESFHASFADFSTDSYSGWNGHAQQTPGYPGATPEKNADSYTQLTMDLS